MKNAMKIFKTLFKILAIGILLIALVIAGVVMYMKFYGKGLLEDALSSAFGSKVKFESISVDIDKYMLNFKNLSILGEIGFDENIFNAKEFTVVLDEERLRKDKKVIFERIIVEKGTLNIERNSDGVFNVSYNRPAAPRRYKASVAYADSPDVNSMYNFAKSVKRFVVKDSVIKFKDYYISRTPFDITCDNFNLDVVSDNISSSGSIPVKCTLSFGIPNNKYRNSGFSLEASAAAYKNMTDMDTLIKTNNIDLMQFLPYFERYTPFSFNEGVFSSTTKFKMRNNTVDSLTTMVLHRLNLIIDPGMQNAKFLEASVNKLAPYLMSGEGDAIFDFVIKGPMDNLRIGLGPQVKFAVGMVMVEEIGNLIQQIQKFQNLRR